MCACGKHTHTQTNKRFCVCIWCMCIYIYIYMHHVRTRIHTRTHAHAHAHTCTYVHLCTCVCVWVRKTVGTWLILPVVICLSQRLSHACLSISLFIRRDCGWLIKSVIVYLMVSFIFFLPTWITVVILELIHAQGPKRGAAPRGSLACAAGCIY
jgi:hypothetical protein